MRFIDIPRKTVEFEDGQIATVGAFRISESCVTIGEFLEFQQATGYVNCSQRKGGKVFLLNELLADIPEHERSGAVAFCLTFVDAIQFCRWAKVRLPTEAEWLAGAIADERIYDKDNPASFPFGTAGSQICDTDTFNGIPRASNGWELTSTRTSNGLVVIRGGPWYFRISDWREERNRALAAPEEVDLFHCFRVVAPKETIS